MVLAFDNLCKGLRRPVADEERMKPVGDFLWSSMSFIQCSDCVIGRTPGPSKFEDHLSSKILFQNE